MKVRGIDMCVLVCQKKILCAYYFWIFQVLMRIVFALLSAVTATQVDTSASPAVCDKVPAGEYYGYLSPGKYLYLEVAEDSASFRTSLGDYADSSDSEMDSDDEDEWVSDAKYLVRKVGFEMKPNCVAEIAQESRQGYGELLRSVSAMVGKCIHQGGYWDMVYHPDGDALTLGYMVLRRAKDGVVSIDGKTVAPTKVIVPRGVFVNNYEGVTHALRIVNGSTAWLKVVKDGKTTRVAAGYQFVSDEEICIVESKMTDTKILSEMSDYLKRITSSPTICFNYSSEKRSMTLGELEFKLDRVVPQ